jgi:integrase
MAQKLNQRRQRHGSAWYWKQTDCWYYTPPGTKRREPLLDGDGKRIRGIHNKAVARLALARVRIQRGLQPVSTEATVAPAAPVSWTVARVCSEYLAHSERAVAAGRMHPEYRLGLIHYLNQFCRYCGALATTELKRGDVKAWVESQPSWRSPVTHRNVITMILAAFNYVEREHGVRNPLKGLKKPQHRPRLQSISPADERLLYGATDEAFRDFAFAAIHTGLRPFCELAKLKAEHVEETSRGMMWRVYSSKTKKTRKIPIRPEAAALTRKLMQTAPPGSGPPIFRNAQGNVWKKPTAVHRFLALKRDLGWDQDEVRKKYSCYTCRHTFAHRMLSGYWNDGVGCSIEVLAELLGDTPKVAFDHYGREWAQHYQDPLWAALGQEPPVVPGRHRSRK